jgi:hypothetical protein
MFRPNTSPLAALLVAEFVSLTDFTWLLQAVSVTAAMAKKVMFRIVQIEA